MTVIFGRNITMGTCVFRPVCSLSPITPMVGFRNVMPAYQDAQICKLVIIALVSHVIVICEHVCIELCCFNCVMPALFVSVASYHIVFKELIDGTKIRLVQ